MNTELPVCTVGYPIAVTPEGEKVLFGKKAATPKAVKRKIHGSWLGVGGDVEPEDATIEQGFARESLAETGLVIKAEEIKVVARILIRDEKGDRLMLYYLIARCEHETPGPNREFDEFRWFPCGTLPEKILGADALILPRIFSGEKLSGFVEYDADMNVVAHDLKSVAAIV